MDSIQGHEAVGGASAKAKPDTSVVLPTAVKAAADRADALSAQVKAAREAAPPNANEPIGEQGVRTNTPAPNGSVITAPFDPRNPRPPEFGDPRSTTSPQPTSPPAPTPPEPGPGDWEHQFKSLKGRFDREAEDKRRLQDQLINTQRLMASITTPPSQPASGAPEAGSGVRFNSPVAGPNGQAGQRRVTQKEIAEYGEELMDVVGRRAQEVYEPLLTQLQQELLNVKRQVGGVQNTVVFDARVKMYDDLNRELPNWNTINTSPEFGAWLDQIDPVFRTPKRNALNAAHNSNQTGQVVDIFKSFLRDAGYSPTNGQAQLAGNGVNTSSTNSGSNSPSPRVDLAQYVAPGHAKTGQTQLPPDKPYYTAQQIKEFYTAKTQGKYAGREDLAAQIEASLFEAGNEGRIILQK